MKICLGPTSTLNMSLEGVEPWKIIVTTAVSVVLMWSLFYLLISLITNKQEMSLVKRLKVAGFKLLEKLSSASHKRKFAKISENMGQDCEKATFDPLKDSADICELPSVGWSKLDVLKQAELYSKMGDDCSGILDNHDDHDLTDLVSRIYGMTAFSNPFPNVRKIEAEVVRMTCNLFGGGPGSCGCVTSGATESLILACKAYRDYARNVAGISRPEMLVPVTAHAGWDQAAQLLDMRIRHVPVDVATSRVDVAAMKRMIGRNTAMLVGSVPQSPHGAVDDIEDIAALGVRHNIPVHVDATHGGFLVVFMKEAGFRLKLFDFRVPGVTSISAAPHKDGGPEDNRPQRHTEI